MIRQLLRRMFGWIADWKRLVRKWALEIVIAVSHAVSTGSMCFLLTRRVLFDRLRVAALE